MTLGGCVLLIYRPITASHMADRPPGSTFSAPCPLSATVIREHVVGNLTLLLLQAQTGSTQRHPTTQPSVVYCTHLYWSHGSADVTENTSLATQTTNTSGRQTSGSYHEYWARSETRTLSSERAVVLISRPASALPGRRGPSAHEHSRSAPRQQ